MAGRSSPAAQPTAALLPLAIYVHWPYCRARCPYCDFNVHVRRAVDHDRWRRALAAELQHYHGGTPGRVVESVYFGGGTPSLMEPETVEAVLGHVRRLWAVADGLEVSLEANPSSADRARFESFRAAGVTRLSLGVQSLDDRALTFLGRDHDRGQALEALDSAREIFPVLSFDLIYARPGQSAAAWRRELGEAVSFEADHVSLYQLTFEPGTAFHAALGRGTIQSLGDGEQAALYE
ncbi:MAG: coproporphyrinogen-III oxidase family protein, partial [Alphaproteobacteria bacterium]